MRTNLNIILAPILSEKSAKMMESLNKYVFKVSVSANKLQIKKELEKRFNVEILKVSTLNFKGKTKNTTIRSGGHVLRSSGKRSSSLFRIIFSTSWSAILTQFCGPFFSV